MSTTAKSEGSARRLALPPLSDAAIAMLPLLVAIIGVGAFAAAESGSFLTLGNFQNIFSQIAVLGVLAVGQTPLLVAGQLDLSVGAGVSLISIVGAEMIDGGTSPALTLIVMLLLGSGIGLFVGLVVAITRVQPFILTLGLLGVLAGVALIISNNEPIVTGLSYSTLSLHDLGPFPVPAVVFGGLCLLGGAILRFTRLGRNAYAIGSNEEAAYIAGVPVGLTKIWLYTLNGLLVGFAAVMLIARLGAGDPRAGLGLELEVVTAIVLGGATLAGGRGTMFGSFLGVFLLGLISNALTIAGLPSSYQNLVYGGVLMAAVVWAALEEMRRASSLPLHRVIGRAIARARSRELRMELRRRLVGRGDDRGLD
jgi:ribose/xylose/arabinose/galactoside ABC-type transport system permease subunit